MNFKQRLANFFLEQIGPGRRFENSVRMADYLGLPPTRATKLYNFLKGADTQYSAVLEWLERLDCRLFFPSGRETGREVCFVDARVVPAGSDAPPPEAENYLAVPLVGEAGAGPGIIPRDDIESWVLVYGKHRSVQRRANLIAVEIGKGQTSMIPTLHPLDIILVDRDDWGQQSGYVPPGNLYLVREPGQEGGGMVKRVATAGKGDTATITFYSDNKEVGPDTYLMSLYEHDMRRAIVGKVVWAWADLSRK